MMKRQLLLLIVFKLKETIMGRLLVKLVSTSMIVFFGLLSTQNIGHYHSLVIQNAKFSAHSASYDSMCAGALGSRLIRINAMYAVQGFIGCSVHADRFVGMDIVLTILGRKMDFHYIITCRYNVTKMVDISSGIAYDVFSYNGQIINGTGLTMHNFAVPNVNMVNSLTNMCDTIDVAGEGMCYQIHRTSSTLYKYFPFGVGLALGTSGIRNVRCNMFKPPILDEESIEALIIDTPRNQTQATTYVRRITPVDIITTPEPVFSYAPRRGRFRSPEAYSGCGTHDTLCTVGAGR